MEPRHRARLNTRVGRCLQHLSHEGPSCRRHRDNEFGNRQLLDQRRQIVQRAHHGHVAEKLVLLRSIVVNKAHDLHAKFWVQLGFAQNHLAARASANNQGPSPRVEMPVAGSGESNAHTGDAKNSKRTDRV